jgi:Flp pilus assembly pilin Flp
MIKSILSNFLRDERGQEALEYTAAAVAVTAGSIKGLNETKNVLASKNADMLDEISKADAETM